MAALASIGRPARRTRSPCRQTRVVAAIAAGPQVIERAEQAHTVDQASMQRQMARSSRCFMPHAGRRPRSTGTAAVVKPARGAFRRRSRGPSPCRLLLSPACADRQRNRSCAASFRRVPAPPIFGYGDENRGTRGAAPRGRGRARELEAATKRTDLHAAARKRPRRRRAAGLASARVARSRSSIVLQCPQRGQ